MSLLDSIKEISVAQADEVVSFRRHLHANPELSYEEFNTAKFIADKLRSFGLEPQEGVATTGVVVLIKGKNPDKKTVALRADIDALPITEENQVAYKSKNVGVMHACGHDVHTSSLLGTAKILHAVKDQFEGTIKLIFQPGEEKNPGGASYMIKEGVLQNPAPASIIGQHVMPLLPVGKIGFREGMYMASSDELYLKVIGKGGHGAAPDEGLSGDRLRTDLDLFTLPGRSQAGKGIRCCLGRVKCRGILQLRAGCADQSLWRLSRHSVRDCRSRAEIGPAPEKKSAGPVRVRCRRIAAGHGFR
jgi:acetylornithine deacetylase/succinyl-diaminopimelate desuccinylase-like protein